MHAAVTFLQFFAPAAVTALFNSLWEAAVLALAVWLLLTFIPNVNATTRYAAWGVVLLASVLLPLASTLPHARMQAAVGRPSASVRSAVRPSARSAAPLRVASVPLVSQPPHRVRISVPALAGVVLFVLWMVAVFALLVRFAVNLYRLERLKRDALPLPPEYRERLPHYGGTQGGVRDVRLCTSDAIEVPVAVGLFDSMILIPRHLLETLSEEQIDYIVLHELAHLRRADDWSNGAQRVIQALSFFNPAVLFIGAQLDLEREVACDDWVLRQTSDARPYASCLTKMAEVTAWPHRAVAAPGVFMTRRGLSIRVERLLRAGRNSRPSIALGPTSALAVALALLFFVMLNVTPSFAFTLPQVVAKRAVAAAIARTPSPSRAATRRVAVPAVHIHVPARTIRIPAMTIHEPAIRIDTRARTIAIPTLARGIARASAGLSHGAGCIACDYSGQNLAGHDFRDRSFIGADFRRASLQNADFSGSTLTGVDFSHANLRGVSFRNANLTGCDLSHADLTGARFDGARMTGCDVDARALAPAQARMLLSICRYGCDFSGANLRGQNLRGISVVGDNLSGADLRESDLSQSSFSGVDLNGAHLRGAKLDGATFIGCDFSGVDLSGVDFSRARIVGSKLRVM